LSLRCFCFCMQTRSISKWHSTGDGRAVSSIASSSFGCMGWLVLLHSRVWLANEAEVLGVRLNERRAAALARFVLHLVGAAQAALERHVLQPGLMFKGIKGLQTSRFQALGQQSHAARRPASSSGTSSPSRASASAASTCAEGRHRFHHVVLAVKTPIMDHSRCGPGDHSDTRECWHFHVTTCSQNTDNGSQPVRSG
jgi:hypothetical protein